MRLPRDGAEEERERERERERPGRGCVCAAAASVRGEVARISDGILKKKNGGEEETGECRCGEEGKRKERSAPTNALPKKILNEIEMIWGSD